MENEKTSQEKEEAYASLINSLRYFHGEDMQPLKESTFSLYKDVIMYRYGIFGSEGNTFKQIGDILGKTPGRIQKIEAAIIRKFSSHTMRKLVHALPDGELKRSILTGEKPKRRESNEK